MKIKNIVTSLLVAILVSCAPAVSVTMIVPTETTTPASTFTSIPPTSTITPTPAPENLADTKDLSKWIDNYVHAFGGKVIVNNVEMNSDQLLAEVKSSPDTYVETQQVNGISYLFFMVNNIPLAFREGNGQWKELTSRKIIEIFGRPDDVFKYFGVQFSNPFFVNTSSKVDDVFAAEFNAAFLNDAYWHVVEQKEGFPNFTNSLEAATKAKEAKMFVIGGQLVDPAGEFDYTYLKNKKNLTRDELLSIMKKHIKMEVEALGKTVDAFVVVNESRAAAERFFGDPNRAYDQFNEIIGEDYIEEAFQTARDTNPNAVLIYNEGFNYHPAFDYTNGSNNTPRTLEIVSRLKAKGLIDGVGLQMHIRASESPNVDKMIKTFKDYEIPVYVTELEINLDDVSGTELEKKQLQEKLFEDVLTAILQTNVTVMVSHWTAIDDTDGNQGQLFDGQLRPTRNLYTERKVLFNYFQNR